MEQALPRRAKYRPDPAPFGLLLRLPTIIIRLILEKLETEDLHQFRLVSQTCREQTDAIIYRILHLHDKSKLEQRFDSHMTPIFPKHKFQQQGTQLNAIYLAAPQKSYEVQWFNQRILNRLMNDQDTLAQHVRHLCIGPFEDIQDCPETQDLVKILHVIVNLESLSWNAHFNISPKTVETFHKSHPLARLHVSNESYRPLPIYKAPLLSPQLHSLSCTVFVDGVVGSGLERRSELQALKRILLEARNLKVLHLRMRDLNVDQLPSTIFGNDEDFKLGPLFIDFQNGDRMPALEVLALDFDQYDLDAEHCKKWLECMEWKSLRTLNLDRGAPKHFLQALTGQLPCLRSLKFGLCEGYKAEDTWQFDLRVVTKFLESIDGLEEVDVHIQETESLAQIWPAFLDKHGPTIRKLKIRYDEDGAASTLSHGGSWEAEQFEELRQKAPRLESLSVNMALNRNLDQDPRSLNVEWPSSTMKVLHHFHHLRTLELVISKLKHRYKTFIPNEEQAVHHANMLFSTWLQHDPGAHIESITLLFWELSRWPFGEARITVERRENRFREYVVKKEFSMYRNRVVFKEGQHDPWG